MQIMFRVLLLTLGLSGAACLRAEVTVASLSTVGTDIVSNVGGSLVRVVAVLKPGVDPHQFQPTPADVKEIVAADMVVISGKHLEGYLAKLEEAAGGRGKFLDLGSGVPSLTMTEDGKTVEDPHWWQSIDNVKLAAAAVCRALVALDPANRLTYERNLASYVAVLDELEIWVKRQVAVLPRDKRKLVTSHDAFQYFAKEYGFAIHSVEGVSPDDEPSSQKIRDLIEAIRREQVKAVFFESIENPKVLGEITRESGAVIGGELYADGLGSGDCATYSGMVRHNVRTIVDALK